MKVEYLFSRNNKIGSKLIRLGSSYEDIEMIPKDRLPSHVAVLLNDKIVIESVLGKGVRMLPYTKWKEKNEELYKVPCEHTYRSSNEVFDHFMEVWGKPYDWYGILFFSWAFIKLMVKKEKLPVTNPLQRDSHFFCTEFAGRLSSHDYSMTTPAKMCDNFLKGSKEE